MILRRRRTRPHALTTTVLSPALRYCDGCGCATSALRAARGRRTASWPTAGFRCGQPRARGRKLETRKPRQDKGASMGGADKAGGVSRPTCRGRWIDRQVCCERSSACVWRHQRPPLGRPMEADASHVGRCERRGTSLSIAGCKRATGRQVGAQPRAAMAFNSCERRLREASRF